MSGITRYFQQSFQVARKQTSDSFGTESWSDSWTIKGYVQPVAGALQTTRGKVSYQGTHVLYCPWDADIKAGDRVTDVYGHQMIAMYAQVSGVAGMKQHMEVDLEDEK